jgi:(S)-ureidoglycine aminohydrolase
VTNTKYFAPLGGLPPQTQLMTGRAVFTDAYAFIPRGVFSDIVTSALPHWLGTKLWLIARPMTGFSETFSQYVMEVAPSGGSNRPEMQLGVQSVLFVMQGDMCLTLAGQTHQLTSGGYAYLPAGSDWAVHNHADTPLRFHWIRKLYEAVDGIAPPQPLITSDSLIAPTPMPNTDGVWATTRFIDPADLSHDMHVNIVTFQPGGSIPFEETHVMEHGLYVLEGKAVYKLNKDWLEVEAGDFMWLRAYCPQACYAAGPGPFRYLLYKDVNRHAKLGALGGFGHAVMGN